MNTKKCTKCGIEKPLTEFHKDKNRKDGHRIYCKVCIAQSSAEYYAIPENKEKKSAEYYSKRKTEQPNCVYQIKNLENNKVYIGETIRGESRWKRHLQCLKGDRHPNKPLQEDFNKYGEEAFEWTILKEFENEDKDLLRLEEVRTTQQYIQDGVELYNVQLTSIQLKMLEEDNRN